MIATCWIAFPRWCSALMDAEARKRLPITCNGKSGKPKASSLLGQNKMDRRRRSRRERRKPQRRRSFLILKRVSLPPSSSELRKPKRRCNRSALRQKILRLPLTLQNCSAHTRKWTKHKKPLTSFTADGRSWKQSKDERKNDWVM